MQDQERNKKLVEAFVANVFNSHDLSDLGQYLREDYIQHNPDCPQGRSGFYEFFDTIFKALPDFHYDLLYIVSDRDRVWIFCTTSGTHTGGDWLGVSASGNHLNFNVVDMFRFQDGLIAEHWDVADTLSLFTQLGKVKG